MKIYIASLSDYNAGLLHGAWFDLSYYDDVDELYSAIKSQVLETSPTAHAEGLKAAEEFAIHDYDGIYPSGLGEYESLSDLMEIQDCLNQCPSYEEEEAFCIWLTDIQGWRSGEPIYYSDFEDAYCGKYNSKEDYAYEFIEETGMLSELPEWAQRYFDYEAYARDMFLDNYTMTEEGYVFRTY